MKSKDVKGMAKEDMTKKAAELKEELFNLRLQNLSGSLENTCKIRYTRREIARLNTYVNQETTK